MGTLQLRPSLELGPAKRTVCLPAGMAVTCGGTSYRSPNLDSSETEVEGRDVKSEVGAGSVAAFRFHLAV
jgi:hypothetical protein